MVGDRAGLAAIVLLGWNRVAAGFMTVWLAGVDSLRQRHGPVGEGGKWRLVPVVVKGWISCMRG